MSKINNTTVYPNITPQAEDFVILTDVSDGDATKTCTVNDLGEYFGVLQVANVTITSKELLSLSGSPKILIPAPGAGKYILVYGTSIVKFIFNTIPYASTGAVILTASSNNLWFSIPNTDLQQSITEVNIYESGVNATNDITNGVNQAVMLYPAGGPLTNGDGEIKMSLQYRIVEI